MSFFFLFSLSAKASKIVIILTRKIFFKKSLFGVAFILISPYNWITSGRKWRKVVDMFFGSFQHTLDSKNRLVIPAKFRNQVGNTLYILKGFDGALAVYKEAEFTKLMEEASSLSFNFSTNRAYLRTQLASVSELEVDKQGRIQIPTQLATRYQIGKEVMVIGVYDHFEIWDKDAYLEYESKSSNDFENIAENIKKDSLD